MKNSENYYSKNEISRVKLCMSRNLKGFIQQFGFPNKKNDYLLSYLIPLVTSIEDKKVVIDNPRWSMYQSLSVDLKGKNSGDKVEAHLSWGDPIDECPQLSILQNGICKTYNCLFTSDDQIFIEETYPIRDHFLNDKPCQRIRLN